MAQANRALKRLPEDARSEVEQVASVTAYHVVSKATSEIPLGPARHRQIHDFKTGVTGTGIHLRTAVSWKQVKGGAVVRVDKEAFHWKFLEYGTVHMRAIGMFRKAGDAMRGDHETRLLQALARANSKMSKGA